MSATRQDWAEAYARQSASDFEVYEALLAIPRIPACHRLHYLQMACEKIAKAYQFRDLATLETKLTSSHIAFSKFIIGYLTSSLSARRDYSGRDEQLMRFRQRARNLAREIERLAPAVDHEQSPSNAEYPWESGDGVTVPCLYTYPNLASLSQPEGRNFLKLIREAILGFDRNVIR